MLQSKREKVYVPLSENVRSLLLKMQKNRHENSDYLFPAPHDVTKPMQGIKSFWHGICKDAGLENVRIHDLRYSFASYLVQSGVSLPVIGRLLGIHKYKPHKRYAHFADAPLREATNLSMRNKSV